MIKKLSGILFVLVKTLFIASLLLSCSKANDPYQRNRVLTEQTTYRTVGNALYLDISDEFVFVAEGSTGVSVFNREDGSVYRQFSDYKMSYFASIYQLRNSRLVRFIPELELLFIWDNTTSTTSSWVFIWQVGGEDDIASTTADGYTLLTPTMFQDVLNDMAYELHPTNVGVIYTYWGSMVRRLPPYLMQRYTFSTDFDIGDSAFREQVSAQIPNETYKITTTEDYIIASMGQWGVNITSKDATLSPVGIINTPGEALAVAYKDGFIYVADRHCGLQVIDFRDITNGVLLTDSARNTTGYASSVDIWEDYLALASGSGGVYLYDISTPTNPRQIERLPLSEIGYANMVKWYAGELYIASRERGVVRMRT